MHNASCGFENPDGIEFLQPSPLVSTTSPLRAPVPTPCTRPPRHLAARIVTSPSALEAERQQVTVHPDVMEERG
jgi:hypothetical protein